MSKHFELCLHYFIHYLFFLHVRITNFTENQSDFRTPSPRKRPGRTTLLSITSPSRYTYGVSMPHVRHITVTLDHRSATQLLHYTPVALHLSYYNDVILSYRCLHTYYFRRWMAHDLL